MSAATAPKPLAFKRPFGIRDKLGYMFGDFGNDFTFILQSTFFMMFYTDVVGVKPVHVGALLMGARILDGFTDVGMGILVDRLPVKPGQSKFKRWIKWIAIPVAAASALMYMAFVADFDSYAMKVVWMCATYLLWGSITYTAINIPYGSMASVVSDNPDDRAQLSVWRSTGATLANLAIGASLPLIVFVKNDQGNSVMSGINMQWSAVVCAVLAVICYAICFALVEERVPSVVKKKEEGGAGIGKMLATVFTNKALLGLIVSALILLLTFMFLGQMTGFLFRSYFNNGQLLSPAQMASLIPSFALIFLSPWLAKKFGKAEVGIVAMFVGGAIFAIAYVMKITNPVVWIAMYAVAMFMIQVFNFLIWALITDVIDYQEVRTGSRDDGTVYAVYSWSRKLGQAFAGGLAGVALSAVGYDQEAAKAGEAQTQGAIDGLYMLANLLPAAGCILVALALLFLYPLKKKRVLENTQTLRERRVAEGLVAADAASTAAAGEPIVDAGAGTDGTPGLEGHPSDLETDNPGKYSQRDE